MTHAGRRRGEKGIMPGFALVGKPGDKRARLVLATVGAIDRKARLADGIAQNGFVHIDACNGASRFQTARRASTGTLEKAPGCGIVRAQRANDARHPRQKHRLSDRRGLGGPHDIDRTLGVIAHARPGRRRQRRGAAFAEGAHRSVGKRGANAGGNVVGGAGAGCERRMAGLLVASVGVRQGAQGETEGALVVAQKMQSGGRAEQQPGRQAARPLAQALE